MEHVQNIAFHRDLNRMVNEASRFASNWRPANFKVSYFAMNPECGIIKESHCVGISVCNCFRIIFCEDSFMFVDDKMCEASRFASITEREMFKLQRFLR